MVEPTRPDSKWSCRRKLKKHRQMTSKEARQRKLKEIKRGCGRLGKNGRPGGVSRRSGIGCHAGRHGEVCRGGFWGPAEGGCGVDGRHAGGPARRRGSVPGLWQGVPTDEEIEARGRAGWRRSSAISAWGNRVWTRSPRAESSRHRSTQDHPPRHDLFDQQRGAHGLHTISPGGTPAHQFPGGAPRKTDQQAGQRDGKVLERRTFGGSDSSTASRGDLRRRPPSSLDHQPPNFPVFPKMSTARAR